MVGSVEWVASVDEGSAVGRAKEGAAGWDESCQQAGDGESAVNVSRLLAWCGNRLGRGEANLAMLWSEKIRALGKYRALTPHYQILNNYAAWVSQRRGIRAWILMNPRIERSAGSPRWER